MKFLKNHILFTPENPLVYPKGVYIPTVPEVLEFLKSNGEKAEAVKGKYGKDENSIMVHNPKNPEGLLNIAKDLGQESAIISNDGEHEMHFLNGPYKGKIVKGSGTNIFEKAPEDLYTTADTVDGPKHFQHNFDFSTLFNDVKKSEEDFNNWVMPNEETAKQEYEWEYKDKGWYNKFNKFHSPKEFHNALMNSQVITVTPTIDKYIHGRGHCQNIQDLKDLVSGYKFPRDVDRIVKGIEKGDQIPYPIIIKHQNRMHILGGNTRMDVARIHGINPQALLLDMDKEDVAKGEFKERAIESLEKEQWRQNVLNPIHGWLSPSGEYHEMDLSDYHDDFISGLGESDTTSAHDNGWVSLAHLGEGRISLGNLDNFNNKFNPANKAFRGLLKDALKTPEGQKYWEGSFEVFHQHPDTGSYVKMYADTDHFLKHGQLKPYNSERLAANELEKGSLQSRHPFKPQDVPADEREKVEDWTGMEKPEAKELIPEMQGNARFRALHKLHGKTQVRVNPQTKEREFLLHRGMSGEEFVKNVKNGKVNHTKMSSWTPIKSAAEGHAFGNEFVDGYSGGTVLSAWIPESKIHYVVPQIGEQKLDVDNWKPIESFDPNSKGTPIQKLNEYTKPAFSWEHEVIVKPNHNSHIEIPPDEALAASEANQINNLEKASNSDRLQKLRNILESEEKEEILDIPESEVLKWSAKWE